ncbi:MAG: hypothetical protein CMB31_01970 [Euryarchaeota archaeon]|nr:hypothetical protein [Euryarchaeota archaeon]
MNMSDWGLLHSKIIQIVEQKDWKPTPIQSNSIPVILEGKDALLVAPTGSGKTESAILPLLSRAISEKWQESSIVYITPLRALNRDIDRRLPQLLEPLNLSVALRHGDTPNSERQRQSKKPPHLWITTPETLQIMLLGSRLREHLSNIKAIIVDEVHDLAASERGSQLLLAMERLQGLSTNKIQRIGLSATVGNPEEVTKWLSNDAINVQGDAPRETIIRVHSPRPSPEDKILALDWRTSAESVSSLRHVTNLVEQESPALIFVNSRNSAETVAIRMRSLNPELKIGVHHGSLAPETRMNMENQLQNGELNAMICTSSMELGIDVGSIKRVHQIESPRAVDRMLQRVGRAEHVLGGVGRGDLVAWKADDIAEGAAIARMAKQKQIEPISWRENPRSVATNQLVLLSLQEGWVRCDQATKLLKKSHLFENWTHDDTMNLLHLLDDRRLVRLVENIEESDPLRWPPKLWKKLAESDNSVPPERPKIENIETMDENEKQKINRKMKKLIPKELEKNGWFGPSGKAAEVRNRGVSMIPDSERYRVRDSVSRRIIGTLDEAFVMGIQDDDVAASMFVMAGRTWMIIDADPDASELTVIPTAMKADAPLWFGELPPVPERVAREVGRMRILVSKEFGGMESPPKGPADHLTGGLLDISLDEYDISEEAMEKFSSSVMEHLELTGYVPHAGLWTLEYQADAIVLNTCQGTKINQTLSDFLQAMASMIDGRMGRTIVDPYRIHLMVPGLTIKHIESWLLETRPDAIDSILRMTTPNSRALRSRVVETAKIMGVISRGIDPRNVNVRGIIKRYKNSPLMIEALDKLFHERLDIHGTEDVLRALQDENIQLVATPSGPLGVSDRAQKDLLLPNYSDEEIRTQVEERLLNERVVQICMNCGDVSRRRVAKLPERTEHCNCGGRLKATSVEAMEERLREWVNSNDPKDRDRMMRNAEIVADRGLDAILCLVARGIGERTATKILSKIDPGNRTRLLRAIHDAEIQYARTSRYWK